MNFRVVNASIFVWSVQIRWHLSPRNVHEVMEVKNLARELCSRTTLTGTNRNDDTNVEDGFDGKYTFAKSSAKHNYCAWIISAIICSRAQYALEWWKTPNLRTVNFIAKIEKAPPLQQRVILKFSFVDCIS